MKTNTLQTDDNNVVDFQEVIEAKSSGSGGGYDHFTGMALGTTFASIGNAAYSSVCDEYMLLQKIGPTVLLLNKQINPNAHWATAEERHVGAKFWKLNTLVQILHVPDKDNNNGNRVEN